MERRLAALLVADIVGFSSRASADESAALAQLADVRAILDYRVQESAGRLFGTAGDGFMVEFPSPVDAVEAAFEIQRDLAVRRRREPEMPELRIGVHLADVVLQDQDLLGDGVNVAARIEGVAQPGAVVISQQVFDQVRRVAPFLFESLGDHPLKGIPEPLTLYRVVSRREDHPYLAGRADGTSKTSNANNREDSRPSVAVLPFANMSGDPEQSYFADGITEDLITDLSRFKSLFVVSRSASFVYRGQPTDPRRIAEELGVRYCIEGSVRKLGDRVRITAQLIDATKGDHLWAERYDAPLNDLFDLQDSITGKIVAAIFGRVEAQAVAVMRGKRPETLDAYDCLLRGLEYERLNGLTQHDSEQAVAWFARSIEKDPNFGRAYAWHACAAYGLIKWQGSGALRYLEESMKSAEKALMLEENDPEVHRIWGSISLDERNYERAEKHLLRSIELNPNYAYMVIKAARLYNMTAEPEKALAMLERAKHLDPLLPDYLFENEVASLYLAQRYTDAMAANARLRRQTLRSAVYNAAASVHAADEQTRERAAEGVLRVHPEFTINSFMNSEPYKDEKVAARVTADLRVASLPD